MTRQTRYISIFVLHCLSFSLQSQTWFNEGDVWLSTYSWFPDYGYEWMTVGGDTMVKGVECKLLKRRTFTLDQTGSRKDTLERMLEDFIVYEDEGAVYYLEADTFKQIYNFNLNVGDMMRIESKWCDEPIVYLLDSLGEVEIGGRSRAIQYATLLEMWPMWDHGSIKIIEGIGIVKAKYYRRPGNVRETKAGYLIPDKHYGCVIDGDFFTFCEYQAQGDVYNPQGDDCDELKIRNSTVSTSNGLELEIIPNPVQREFTVEGIDEELIERIELYGIEGRMIDVGEYKGSLNLSGLADGMYILKVAVRGNYYVLNLIKK